MAMRILDLICATLSCALCHGHRVLRHKPESGTPSLSKSLANALLASSPTSSWQAISARHGHGMPSRREMIPSRTTSRLTASPMMEFVSSETCTGEKLVVVGATGYIGKAVVRESVRRGYPTQAVVRDTQKASNEPKFKGASMVQCDVTDPAALAACPTFQKGNVDVVVSCLASRTGTKSDSFAIDYQATLNVLNAARAAGARHFVLLSAYCVLSAERGDDYALQFQYAKKKFELEMADQTDMTWTSVRPTAFFKSVSGQLEVVNSGAPFVYFDLGGGKCATCNPISEADLAVALIDTVADPKRKNMIWNIGGPDEGLSMKDQGEMLADVLGKEPSLFAVPIGLFDVIIGGIQGSANFFKGFGEPPEGGTPESEDSFPPPAVKDLLLKTASEWGQKLDDAAELGRIGKYYAVEDMLTQDPADKFGSTTLRQHYEKIAVEGQEYDPYTTMFASAAGVKDQRGLKSEEEMKS